MINAYPLQWPAGWPRTPLGTQRRGKFGVRKQRTGSSYLSLHDVTITEAVGRVLAELERMGISRADVVISTNVRVRQDGLPRSGEREPADAGAAVYWQTHSGPSRVMAIDAYVKVADNIAALAATLDAMRAIERHGGAVVLERAFTGFAALPAPTAQEKRDWRTVLELLDIQRPTREDVKKAYRRLASLKHPDLGGSHDAMAELNVAQENALSEIFQ